MTSYATSRSPRPVRRPKPERTFAVVAIGVITLVLTLAGVVAAPSAVADSGTVSPGCQLITTKVPGAVLADTAADGTETVAGLINHDVTISGRLCVPNGGAKTVVLALHGVTYTSEYWDSQYQPETYSFARRAMKEGYAAFAIDRLGHGRSSRALGTVVTLDVQARVAHEIVRQLRSGDIGGRAFPFVALLGHSYGSATSWLEAATWNDTDAVIATGWGSTIQTQPLARFFSGFYPAAVDPKFAGSIVDPNYLTPLPGGRNQNFLYDLSNVDPGMIEYDEDVLRDTVTTGEGVTFYNRYGAIPVTYVPTTSEELELPLSNHTKAIAVPTFLVDGTNELFFCGADRKNCNTSEALLAAQQPYFSPAACLRTAVVPNAGHDLNLQRNAQTMYDQVIAWLDQSIGRNGEHRDAYRSACQEK